MCVAFKQQQCPECQGFELDETGLCLDCEANALRDESYDPTDDIDPASYLYA